MKFSRTPSIRLCLSFQCAGRRKTSRTFKQLYCVYCRGLNRHERERESSVFALLLSKIASNDDNIKVVFDTMNSAHNKGIYVDADYFFTQFQNVCISYFSLPPTHVARSICVSLFSDFPHFFFFISLIAGVL